MNERAQAIETLKKARDLLAEQLTERIIEAREEILDDATGDSFLGEIEQIYEKFGNRLGHLNSLLGSLPPVVPGLPPEKPSDVTPAAPAALPAPQAESAASEGAGNYDAVEAATDGAVADDPTTVEAVSVQPAAADFGGESERVTFETFVERLRANDMHGAGEVLGVLFGVDADRGARCAVVFAEKFVADQTVMFKAMNLRTQLQVGDINASLMLLWECFGLQGLESIGAMQTLKASLASAS